MPEDLLVSKLFKDLVIATSNSLGEEDIERQFTGTIGGIFGVDKVVITANGRTGSSPNDFYGYVTNTKKIYVDNQLSEYSSFPELIGYKNRGYKSCAAVPIIVSGKVVSIVEMLSLSENKFSNELINSASLGAYFTALALLYKYESDKSLRLASYFNSAFGSSEPQMLVASDGKVVKLNDGAKKEFLGMRSQNISIQELLGIDFQQFSAIAKAGSSKVPIGEEDRKKIYRINANKINEKLLYISLNDITELEKVSKLFGIMDADASVGIIYLDKDFKVLRSTKSIKAIIGYDENLVVGKNLIELAVDKQRGELKELFATLAKKEKIHAKMDLLSRDGLPSHVDFVLSKSDDGYLMLFKEAETEGYLQTVSESFTDFVSNTSDLVITMDTLGYIKECNMPVESVLGYSRSELVGKEMRSLYLDPSIFEKHITFARNGGKIDNSYVVMIKKNGDKLDATHSIRLFRDPEKADYLIVIKELETKRKLTDLEEKVEKEDAKIARLKGTGELKSQFIYNISHELKTPLTNIKGFSKLLYQGDFGPLNSEQLSYINTIIDEADRLMLIIQQVLDAAKLESEKMTLELREVNLKEMGNNATIQAMKETAEHKGLKFEWIVDFDVPNIIADPNRLIQVFVNLIGNSIKFTDNGKITVKISKKTKGSIKCDVIDTGIGISEEDRRKLFKKFYEAPKKGLVKQKESGTGLGLSITREIVRLHGGNIICESEVDKGSKFSFTLRVKPKKKKKEV